jgi:hypothetical protein
MNTIDTFLQNWKEASKQYHYELLAEYNRIKGNYISVKKETQLEIHKIERDFLCVPTYHVYDTSIACYTTMRNECKKLSEEEMNQDFLTAYSEYESFKANTVSGLSVVAQMAYEMLPNNPSGDVDAFLNGILDREVAAKKASLIKRIEKKAGKFSNCDTLSIGVDGNINGYIQGEIGEVAVSTIYAGGYNIQRLHYRVLVKLISTNEVVA